MKKVLSTLVLAALVITFLPACGGNKNKKSSECKPCKAVMTEEKASSCKTARKYDKEDYSI